MDLLSTVLLTLKVVDSLIIHYELAAPWGFLAPSRGFQVLPQDSGTALIFSPIDAPCWVSIHGRPPVRVEAADSALVVLADEAVVFQSDPQAPVQDMQPVWRDQGLPEAGTGWDQARPVRFRWCPASSSGEPVQRLLGVLITVQEVDRNPLFKALPSPLVVGQGAGRMFPWLATVMQFLLLEEPRISPGYEVTSRHLATLIFTSLVRAHVAGEGSDSATWLRGLSDPKIGRALGLMHGQPGEPWTLQSLARACGMSRTSFAQRFVALVGTTPMAHLTAARMDKAARQLIDGSPVGQVAADVGFRSDWAFRRAFVTRYGITPFHYKKLHRVA